MHNRRKTSEFMTAWARPTRASRVEPIEIFVDGGATSEEQNPPYVFAPLCSCYTGDEIINKSYFALSA